MKGFHHTVGMASAASAPSRHPDEARPQATGIAEAIIAELRSGSTPRLAAEHLHLPLDFVEMVIEEARAEGKLDILRIGGAGCSLGSCSPDPDSLVCAGCPVMVTAKRRKPRLRGGVGNHISKLVGRFQTPHSGR